MSQRFRGPRHHDETGSAIVEFVWLGLILMVPIVYILLAVFDLQRASYGVSAASRAAGRAFVLAPDQGSGYARAQRAAEVALKDQGIEPGGVAVRISCTPDPERCLSPGAVISVAVRTSQPLPFIPSALGGSRPAVTVNGTHTEPYGTFREDRS